MSDKKKIPGSVEGLVPEDWWDEGPPSFRDAVRLLGGLFDLARERGFSLSSNVVDVDSTRGDFTTTIKGENCKIWITRTGRQPSEIIVTISRRTTINGNPASEEFEALGWYDDPYVWTLRPEEGDTVFYLYMGLGFCYLGSRLHVTLDLDGPEQCLARAIAIRSVRDKKMARKRSIARRRRNASSVHR